MTMPRQTNGFLVLGAVLSALAAVLHLLIIAGGPEWYRFFGAGERMATAAAQGHVYPTAVTLAIAVVLALWSAYALSGAGAIRALPLLKVALVFITGIYLLRGIGFAPAVLKMGGEITPFVLWSSAICLGFGVVHLVGLVQRWRAL